MTARTTRSLPCNVGAPGQAREAVADLRGDLGEGLTEDVQLVVSELVADCVVHGGGDHIVVELDSLPRGRVRGRVIGSDASGRPLPNGLGRKVVDALATAWGVADDGTGAWFEIRRPGRTAPG